MNRMVGTWLVLALLAGAGVAPEQARARAQASAGTRADAQKLLQQLREVEDPLRAKRLRERLLQAWLAAGPVSAQVLLKQAGRAQAAGLVDTAEQLLRLAAERWPDFAEARFRLAFLLWQRGRVQDALTQLDALLARMPAHFPALSLKVRLLLQQERRKDASQACAALLRAFPRWREMRRRCERLRWRLEQDA